MSDAVSVTDASDVVKNIGGVSVSEVFVQKAVLVDPSTLDPWDGSNPLPVEES